MFLFLHTAITYGLYPTRGVENIDTRDHEVVVFSLVHSVNQLCQMATRTIDFIPPFMWKINIPSLMRPTMNCVVGWSSTFMPNKGTCKPTKFTVWDTWFSQWGYRGSAKLERSCTVTFEALSAKSEDILQGNKIRIKITGDNTQVARNLNVENFPLTILEEGQIACSSMGNNTVSILKIPETYHATSIFYRQIDTNGKTHHMNHLESTHKLKDESTLSDWDQHL